MAINEFPILDEVKAILTERQQMYGRSEDAFQTIVDFWNVYLQKHGITTPLDKKDAALMMALMKMAREMFQHKHDNLADIIGYASHADRIARSEEEFQKAFDESVKEDTEQPNDGECSLADFDKAMNDWLDALDLAKKLSGFNDNNGGKGGAPAMKSIYDEPRPKLFEHRVRPTPYEVYLGRINDISGGTARQYGLSNPPF